MCMYVFIFRHVCLRLQSSSASTTWTLCILGAKWKQGQLSFQLLFFVFFILLTRVSEEYLYALCVRLAKDNTILTKHPISKQQRPTQEKQESINQKVLSENNAAIEVKKKKGRKRKLLPFYIPSTGPHQFQSPSQLKGKNRHKGKRGLHT